MPVGRAIIDDNQLDSHGHREHAPDDLLDRVLLVVGRHHDRHERVVQHAAKACHQRPIEKYEKPCACMCSGL